MTTANSKQVGGTHYGLETFQHWDWVELNGVPYLEGCISKYVSRWVKKNGKDDLQKALHYTEKLWELVEWEGRKNFCRAQFTPLRISDMVTTYNLSKVEEDILYLCVWWDCIEDIKTIHTLIQSLIDNAPLKNEDKD